MINPETVSIGAAIWRAVRPWQRLKILRNKRRARLGKPLLPITQEDYSMLPNGTATYTGAAIAGAGPVVGIVTTMASPVLTNLLIANNIAPAMCTAGAENCVSASALSMTLIAGVVSLLGAWIAKWGRARAEARHAAELAAAVAVPAPTPVK